ncbi:MAG: type II-A CRISPR-associated protein Csn2 [Mycoplasmatota bacterium]
MKINFDYLDNSIDFDEFFVNSLCLKNKHYFYRVINDLVSVSNKLLVEEVNFFENNKEINLSSYVDVYIDFFNIDLNSKKIIGKLYDLIDIEIDEEIKNKIRVSYKKMLNSLNSVINNFDFSLSYEEDFDIKSLLKLYKISVNKPNTLLEQLLLLLELNSVFKLNKLLVFVNLEDYLTIEELKELIKYAIYNNLNIFLINNEVSDYKLDDVKYCVIEEDLNEFVISN